MAGFFDTFFDFNHDGKLSAFEQGMKWGTIAHIMSESTKTHDDSTSNSSYFAGDTFASGLDVDDLEFMDEDERRETLTDAGLDPDDFDLW